MQFRFSDFVLDTDSLRLTREGQVVPVEPQVFDLIRHLVAQAGRVVSKDELIEAVWQGRVVSDATISARINAARVALGDDGKRQAVIRTAPRRGFEWVLPIERNAGVAADAAPDKPTRTVPLRQRIRYAKSHDGVRIAYSLAGSGPPVMRMSHHLSHLEMDWNSSFWQPVFERLAAGRTLLRYDARGTGLSDSGLEGAGIADYVADMKAVVDAAGYDEFSLVTHLQSAPVALHFMAENPGRVTRLVVQEGYVRGRGIRAGSPASPDADPVIALMRNGWGDPANGFMRGWLSMIIPGANHEETTEMINLISGVASREDVVAARQIIDKFTAEDVLHKITTPTLVIHARNDTIHPLAEAQELAMGIEGAELLVAESSNTLCIPSDPSWEVQMSAMLEFLGEA